MHVGFQYHSVDTEVKDLVLNLILEIFLILLVEYYFSKEKHIVQIR